MSPHHLITANTTWCVNSDAVEVAQSALPHIERWLRENAASLGYVRVSEANRAGVTQWLAQHPDPCHVADTGDER